MKILALAINSSREAMRNKVLYSTLLGAGTTASRRYEVALR